MYYCRDYKDDLSEDSDENILNDFAASEDEYSTPAEDDDEDDSSTRTSSSDEEVLEGTPSKKRKTVKAMSATSSSTGKEKIGKKEPKIQPRKLKTKGKKAAALNTVKR
jgi:hypothetical protein